MVKVTAIFVLSALACFSSAAPFLEKRIAQTTIDSVTPWETACDNAGGGTQCNPIAVSAAQTLLSAAGPCAQQDAGDQMIDLAKQLNNDADMIKLAQIFVQQPRNAGDSLQVPYCQQPPKNQELNGLFHCQFAGSKFPNFSGDGTGNVPLGLSAPVNPAGSCPAKPDGPVPDGDQLNTLVQEPVASGVTPGGAGANNNSSMGAAGSTTSAPTSPSVPVAAPPASSPATNADATSTDFKKQNGIDAQSLNQKFNSLNANSPCTTGEDACVNNEFAQCVGGKFVLTSCSGGLICAALPLVNAPGTSVTCTTAADRDARIATALAS